MTWLEWARGAVQKHGWKHAAKIAGNYTLMPSGFVSPFFVKVAEWIDKNAPQSELSQ